MDANKIEHVGRFNREVTRRIGVLSDDYLRRGRSLAESRLRLEIGPDGPDGGALRARVAPDSGYPSRLPPEPAPQKHVRTGHAAGGTAGSPEGRTGGAPGK